MKHIKHILIALLLLAVGVACDNDSTDNISFVTTYPVIDVEGNAVEIINLGDGFTDPGAVATIGDEVVDMQVESDVDDTQAGIYTITYTSVNTDGYSVSSARLVIVIDPATDATDHSGVYVRSGNANNITKIGPSMYRADNAGGAFAPGDARNLDIVFYNYSGNSIVIPPQTAPNGVSVQSINDGTAEFTATGLNWAISASNFYGSQLRTFTKQ